MKSKMKVVVGEPGSGKSTLLIEKAIKLARSGHEVFITAPSHKAKERLIEGFKQRLDYNVPGDQKILTQLLRSTHVTIKNYHGEIDILLDEVSMLDMTSFYALLYQFVASGAEHHITAYGDIEQLLSVKDVSVLETLLRANERRFPAVKRGFWSWVKSDCYIGIEPGALDVPESWGNALKSIEIEALTENYRLRQFGDGTITNYGDEFYSELFNNYVSQDYTNALAECVEDDWLILAPTYDRGDEANTIIRKHYGNQKYKKLAPFVRKKDNKKEVYLNPDCVHFETLRKRFGFIKPFNENLKRKNFDVTCFLTVHSVQGGQAPSIALFLGDTPISSDRKFYSRNMLYTAMTRGGNWKLLGNKGDFALMATIDPEDPKTITNNMCNSEALVDTMQTLIELRDVHILNVDEVYNLFLENYAKLTEKIVHENIAKPYSLKQVMRAFSSDGNWNTKLPLKYGAMYFKWAKKSRAEGNAKGGKNSRGRGKNQQLVNSFSEEKKKQMLIDIRDRNIKAEAFKKIYGLTKKQAGRLKKEVIA